MPLFKRLRVSLLRAALAVRDVPLFLVGHLWRIPRLMRKTWDGNDPMSGSKLVAVFVHYDREGLIHDYVVHQLKELTAAGFRVVFVSNSPKFPRESVELTSPFCQKIIWRYNIGYDFGAYKDGLDSIEDKQNLSALLLMNDSIYGPFSRLRDVLADIDRATTDYWGITDSWEMNFHIQSYFMLFFPTAIASTAFKKFWRRFPYVNNKSWIIRNGEVKLSRVLAQQKLRANVLAPYWSVSKAALDRLAQVELKSIQSDEHRSFLNTLRESLASGRPINPMHYFWDMLILDYKCPFIKRELMKSNPSGVPFAWRWPEVVQQASRYDTSMIWRHLQS